MCQTFVTSACSGLLILHAIEDFKKSLFLVKDCVLHFKQRVAYLSKRLIAQRINRKKLARKWTANKGWQNQKYTNQGKKHTRKVATSILVMLKKFLPHLNVISNLWGYLSAFDLFLLTAVTKQIHKW